jgi:hemerythrin-like metal-binding protein
MPFFEWDPTLDVGSSLIDRDHRMFAKLINELHEAVQKKKGDTVLRQVLSGVVNLLAEHFAREEELMRKHEYPDYSGHKLEHDLFGERLRGLQREAEDGTGLPTIETLSAFADWFRHHTTGTDKKLAAYVLKNRRGGDR